MLIRKPYLVLTDSHIEYRWLYGHKIVAWADIERVAFHWKANVLFLSIWANEHGARRSVWEWLDCITGRDYSFSIGVSIFPSVDFEKLFLAMNR
nr:PH domain-containing protein [Paenibacillus sp. OV219]